jgi:hypothetical protein
VGEVRPVVARQRIWRLGNKAGRDTSGDPLKGNRTSSFYTMRTDSRDRFGTPLEQRFTRAEIADMMGRAGLENVVFSKHEPFWHAVGTKCPG